MHKAYVDRWIRNTGLEVVGCYKRAAVLSQDRAYDYRLAGIVNETGLSYSMPREFSTNSSYKGVAKYADNQSELWADQNLQPLFDYFEARVSVFCESKQISWMDAWPETDHTTSTGYPVNQRYRDKATWFARGAKFINHAYVDGKLVRLTNPLNMDEYRDFLRLSTYDECISLWNVFSKNEALPNEKIQDDRLRQINGGDCRFIAMQSEYFKTYNDDYISNWKNGHSRAGMPIQHGVWDWLARQHWKYEWSYIIDIHRQDSTMPAAVQDFMYALRLASGLNKVREPLIPRLLHESVKKSYLVMPDGVVIKKYAGNDSGQFNTLDDATQAGDIYMMFAWMKLSKLPLADFDVGQFYSCCGDDGWLSGDRCDPKKTPKWWTPQAITKLLADYGISADVRRVKTRDATFLSHSTVQYNGMLVPYPVNHHKAVVNVLWPQKKSLNNAPLLLGRILAQRNRFFADSESETVSYWRLFDALADVYRPLAKEQRDVFPTDYKAAKALDLVPQSVALLYKPTLESSTAVVERLVAALKVVSDGEDC